MAERFRQNIRNSTVVALDNCGHAPHEEYPTVVSKLITEFIGEAKPPSVDERHTTN